jgi:hypothetical protein
MARRGGWLAAWAAINTGCALMAAAEPRCSTSAAAARASCAASEWCAAQVDADAASAWEFEQVFACACDAASANASLAAATAGGRALQHLPLCGSGQRLSADALPALHERESGCDAVVCRCQRDLVETYAWSVSEKTCDFTTADQLTPTLSLAITVVIVGQALTVGLASLPHS